MKRRCLRLLFVACLSALALPESRGQTNTIIIPKEAEHAFGNIYSDPLFTTSGVQQIYAATEFAGAPSDILTITEIAFRTEETQQGIDTSMDLFQIIMSHFPGSMQEVAEGRGGLVAPVSKVFYGENVRVVAEPGQLNAFDVRFRLQKPFVYDRRRGQLVLHFSGLGDGLEGKFSSIDTHAIMVDYWPSFHRGALVYPSGFPTVYPSVLVTRFAYSFIASRVISIVATSNRLQIEFTLTGEAASVTVEASAAVGGTYEQINEVDLTALGNGTFRASLALPSSDKFFRIALH